MRTRRSVRHGSGMQIGSSPTDTHSGRSIRKFCERGHPLLFIDDNGRTGSYAADIILQAEFLRPRHGVPQCGEKYACSRPQYASCAASSVGTNRVDIRSRARCKILISLGSRRAQRHRPCPARLERIDDAHRHCRHRRQPARRNARQCCLAPGTRVTLLTDSSMPGLMAGADLAVIAGGSTCYEILYMGLPAIVLVTAENQERNVRALAEAEAIVNAGWNTSISDDALLSLFRSVLCDRGRRARLSAKGPGIVDGRGCSRVLSVMQHGSRQ